MSTTSQPAIRSFTERPGAKLQLYCFPYSGGSAQIYKDWGKSLPGHVDVRGVQLPGRASRFREPRYLSVEEAIQGLLPEFLGTVKAPFVLFGHSLGAALAFEMAHELERAGQPPALLVVSGMMGPRLPSLEPPIYHLPDEQFKAKLREFNGTPHEVLEHEELMDLLLPLLKADFTMADTYTYREGRGVSCPIAAFASTADPHTNAEGVQDWRSYTSGPFSEHHFPGDHFFIHTEEPRLLATLAQYLHRLG